MSDDDLTASADFEREWRLAEAAKDRGDLALSSTHLEAALAASSGAGDEELAERVLCAQAAVAFALGGGEEFIPRLCAVVLRNRSLLNGFVAANNLARAHELRREHSRGVFYARIARQRAEMLGRHDLVAAAVNQMANLLLADSHFEEAATTYGEALRLLPQVDDKRQLTYLANLGYCEIVLGRYQSGMRFLHRCLRTAIRHRWPQLAMIAHIDLCYGHLELARYESAERHGRRGLALAETIGESDWIKNGLYLLGEAAVLAGAESRAYAWFHELQRRFYPAQAHLPEFLLSVDIRKLINLRA